MTDFHSSTANAEPGFSPDEMIAVEIVKKARAVYENHEDDGAWIAMELAYVRLITEALNRPAQGSLGCGAKAYVDRAVASYAGDPPDSQFQRGFLAALEVVRDEAFHQWPSVPAIPDLEGWNKVGNGTPLNAWLETKLYTEDGFTESLCRVMSIGDDPEWIARDGRTTVTHHSYAAPTHWRWPKPVAGTSSLPSTLLGAEPSTPAASEPSHGG